MMHKKRLNHKPRLLFDRGKRNYEYLNCGEGFSRQEHLLDKGMSSCEALSPANEADNILLPTKLFGFDAG